MDFVSVGQFIGAVGVGPAFAFVLLLRLEPRLRALERAILLLVASNGRKRERTEALRALGVETAAPQPDSEMEGAPC
jgi:hypothetical protein